MQVAKKKNSNKKPEQYHQVFKTVSSQAELKRFIEKYMKSQETDTKNKLTESIKEAREDVKRDKLKKKDDERELNKAKMLLSKEALEMSGYDTKHFDEILRKAELYPKEFIEIVQSNKLKGLREALEEYKKQKIDEMKENVEAQTLPLAMPDNPTVTELGYKNALDRIMADPDIQKDVSGSIIDGITEVKFISKKTPNDVIVLANETLKTVIFGLIQENPDISVSDVNSFMKDKLDIDIMRMQTNSLLKVKKAYKTEEEEFKRQRHKTPVAPTKTLGPAAAAGPATKPAKPAHPEPKTLGDIVLKPAKQPAKPTDAEAHFQDGHGLSGFIGGKVIKDVLKRFKILVGEASSGNTSPEIKAEIFDVIDFLRKNGKISKPQHNRIVKAFQLHKP